jgi:hypothetical protein
MRAVLDEAICDEPGGPEPDQHADPVSSERDQSLSRALAAFAGLGVREDLSRDEEEVVADPMQRNADQ